MKNSKLIYRICMDNKLAIGDNSMFLEDYLEFLTQDMKDIAFINYFFKATNSKHPDKKNLAFIYINDADGNSYNIAIKTNGFYGVIFDNSDVNFVISLTKCDIDGKLVNKKRFESDYHFGNKRQYSVLDNEGLTVFTNESGSWNNIFAKTAVDYYSNDSINKYDLQVNDLMTIGPEEFASDETELLESESETIVGRLNDVTSNENLSVRKRKTTIA